MQKKIFLSAISFFFLAALVSAAYYVHRQNISQKQSALTFSEKTTLEETGTSSGSLSPNWWLNSGGFMAMENGSARTNFGSLPEGSRWQKLYAKTNSRDTDDGYFPQNIFRLVTRQKWQHLDQQLFFNIDKINMSASENRNESNGVLLFNRYYDGNNLYYAGLRVDGHAIIKKKIDGKYYTLSEKDVLSDGKKYDQNDDPNFLPLHQWLGIRSVVTNIGSQAVDIKFYVDLDQTGDWQLVLETQDKGSAFGSAPLFDPGRAGIRTDFMDVVFQNYKIQ
jgi:hypothetical protein